MFIKSPIERPCSFIKEIAFNKEIKSAKITVTAIGFYYCLVNDKAVTDTLFNPGWTAYEKRVQTQCYDVTNLVNQKTKFEFQLAAGWGGSRHLGWMSHGQLVYTDPCLYFEIEIEYVDGQKEVIKSDESWDVFTNEYEFAEIYDGETVNALYEREFLGKAVIHEYKTKLIPQEGPYVVRGERIPAKELIITPKGERVIDFKQNFAGYVEFKIKGNRGDKLVFTPAEILDKDGNFYNENYRSAKSTFSYVLTGEEQLISARFSWLGGRYIKIIEGPENIDIKNVTAVLVHSDIKRTSYFECGDEKINRLYKNVIYGQLSNYIDVPTDCPQRDERLGWTGDAQAFTKTAAINFDVKDFFKKWINDMIVQQEEDGFVNGVIPNIFNYRIISAGWCDASVICPYEIYQAYGDKELLKSQYDLMIRYHNFCKNNCVSPYICYLGPTFGDWLSFDQKDFMRCVGSTDLYLIATAFYCYITDLLAYMSKELGYDNSEFVELGKNIRKAYQQEFIVNGHMKGEKALIKADLDKTCYTQSGIVFTLYFNLCKEEDKPSLLNDLLGLIKECGGVMTTGFLGTPFILYVLSNNGYKKEAYDLLFQEKFPSWLYSVNQGATTMWEHWDGINDKGEIWPKSMNSFNHYAYGAVYGWMFNNSVGINLIRPNYQEIEIKPLIDKRLRYVKGKYLSSYGEIEVEWIVKENEVSYYISIPKGITAHISLEDGFKKTISGDELVHITK